MKYIVLCLFAAVSTAAGANSPSNWLNFKIKPVEIQRSCDMQISNAESKFSAIENLSSDFLTFDNTAGAFESARADFSDATGGLTFLNYVHPDKTVRDAGHQCETKTQKYLVELFTREKLYLVLKSYSDKKEALSSDQQKLLDRLILVYKRNGLGLPPDQREEVKQMMKKLVEQELSFDKNVNEYKDSLEVTQSQLKGLAKDYISKLKKTDKGYLVTLKYPDYFPFMRNAKDAAARQALEYKFNNRAAKANTALLEDIAQLRHEIAQKLGYTTHAHYVLEDRMAKNPDAVRAFWKDLRDKLRPLAQEELDEMRKLKKKEGHKDWKTIHEWDWRYYHNELKKTQYKLDDEKIKQYFPMQVVTDGMLEVYQKLLDVKFREITPAYAWHPDVQQFEIKDNASNQVMGYFYLDLYPREGKYNHAAAFTLVKGRQKLDGSYQSPVAAMVTNFNKPTADKPSLLTHNEVETYFHEFGHIMHQTLTRARYGLFSGTSVSRDFVEAPSQMLENWVWNPKVLASLSGHYKDPSKKLPQDTLNRMIEAKNLDAGIIYLRQVFYGMIDFEMHSQKRTDITLAWSKLRLDASLIPMTPGTHPHASYAHMVHGYDAGYYGYLWSEVYSADMFSRFEERGVLDAQLGRQYRELILEPGRSQDELGQVVKFLGREPNNEAFLKAKGLK